MARHGGRTPLDYKNFGKPGRRGTVRRKKGPGGRFGLTLVLLFLVGLGWLLGSPGEKSGEKREAEPAVVTAPEKVRKRIVDRNFQALAVSFPVYAAFIKPLELGDVAQTAVKLSTVLGLDEKALAQRLRSERTFVWLGRFIPAAQADKLLALDISGLYLRRAATRYYPQYNAAAQIMGYVQDNHGLSGAELYYDQELLGEEDLGAKADAPSPSAGKHVVLTLDLQVQTMLEKQMALLAAQTKAASVSAMAVNPADGAVLAYAQYPSFDPNIFWESDSRNQQVKAVATLLNPGAISSIFRYGAAIHAGHDQPLLRREVSDHLIQPRRVKRGSVSRGGHWWPWPQGGFISDELGELPDPSVSDSEFLAFQGSLGISCADGIDLPEKVVALRKSEQCGEGFLNSISLLGGFCRLINGGQPVQLHVKKGELDDDGRFQAMIYQAKGGQLATVSEQFRATLAEVAGEDAKFTALEYLAPITDNEIIVSGEGGPPPAAEDEGVGHDGLLLATGPAPDGEVALLVAVENGRFDVNDASPMRHWAGRFYYEFGQTDLTVSAELPESLPQDSAQVYDLWLREQGRGGEVPQQAAAASGQVVMPDLRGRSLRKALNILQPLMVEVDISGAGAVVAQEPEAGAEISGERVILRLARPRPEGEEK
ncbi:MAG: PASTA domain-containing protein [Thermodesulfobacteriota bacterium]